MKYLIYHYFEKLYFSDDFAFEVSTINHENHCVSSRIVSLPNATNTLLAT